MFDESFLIKSLLDPAETESCNAAAEPCCSDLHDAVSRAHKRCLQLLLDSGCAADGLHCKGVPLITCVMFKKGGLIKQLLDAGADLHLGHRHADTLLMSTAMVDNPAATATLLEYGADVQEVNASGKTALHIAAEMGFRKTVKLLLAAGAHLEAEDDEGDTPLHTAAASNNWNAPDCVVLLLQAGANPHALNDNYESPLEVAAQCTTAIALRRAGADIERGGERMQALECPHSDTKCITAMRELGFLDRR